MIQMMEYRERPTSYVYALSSYADMKPRTRRRSKSGQRRAAAKRWWVR